MPLQGSSPHSDGPDLLVVCTANQCRSPLGEYAIRARMLRRGLRGTVGSAGTAAVEGIEATDGAVRAGRKLGFDLTPHLSRAATTGLVGDADLVVTMERRHVVHVVTELGADLSATFTLPELAGLASELPREPGEAVPEWIERINVGRRRHAMLDGPNGAPEIDDPTGWGGRRHIAAARRIDDAVTAVLDGMYGPAEGR